MTDREKIRKEAKAIMDDFIRALEKIGSESGEFGLERKKFLRSDFSSASSHPGFRKRMFANAPRKNDNYLIMDKKRW